MPLRSLRHRFPAHRHHALSHLPRIYPDAIYEPADDLYWRNGGEGDNLTFDSSVEDDHDPFVGPQDHDTMLKNLLAGRREPFMGARSRDDEWMMPRRADFELPEVDADFFGPLCTEEEKGSRLKLRDRGTFRSLFCGKGRGGLAQTFAWATTLSDRVRCALSVTSGAAMT